MEFLSDQFNAQSGYPVNLVLQSPASLEAGDNAANTSTFDPHPLPFNPDGEFHEYRFDVSILTQALLTIRHCFMFH